MKTATILFYVTHERIKIKQLKAIDKLIMQLPPHSGQSCITNIWDNETIDELIDRIQTSEGLYKLSWILSQKANSPELDKNQREITMAKARSASDRAMHLVAIEQSKVPNTIEHTIAISIAQRKAIDIVQADVQREKLRATRERKTNDSSGGKESLTHNTVVNVAQSLKRLDLSLDLSLNLT